MSGSPSPEEFRDYLELLRKLLRLRSGQSEAIAEELRSHLESRFAQLTQHGVEPKEAISTALAEFGDAASLAAELSAVSRLRLRRRVMRFTIGSLIATGLIAVAIVSFWPDQSGTWQGHRLHAQQREEQEPRKTGSSQGNDANEATWKILEQSIDVSFSDATIDDALRFLADEKKLQFFVDRRRLKEEEGISTDDTAVSIHLSSIPVEMALRLLLGQHGLTFTLDHGVVIIMTIEEASFAENLHVRIYPVGDLLEKPKPEKKTPAVEADGVVNPAGGRGIGGSGGGIGGGLIGGDPGGLGGSRQEVGPPYDISMLADVIRESINPDSWQDRGGSGFGTIHMFRDTVVIAQTVQNHRKIERFLQELRSAIGRQETTTQ